MKKESQDKHENVIDAKFKRDLMEVCVKTYEEKRRWQFEENISQIDMCSKFTIEKLEDYLKEEVLEEDKRAYSEVVNVLNGLSDKDYKKIPEDVVLALEERVDIDYIHELEEDKTLTEDEISVKAQSILAIIFRDYLASKRQKYKILKYENIESNKLEEEKIENTDLDDTVIEVEAEEEIEIQQNVALIEYKENIFKRFLNKIFAIFKKQY